MHGLTSSEVGPGGEGEEGGGRGGEAMAGQEQGYQGRDQPPGRHLGPLVPFTGMSRRLRCDLGS